MNKISSVDSGEYKCRSSNEHGEKLSEALTLNVLYPPRSISVSISPSGEIGEGSSVTLTCSSDANPPVQNYTWFKEGGISPVGSGQNYSFTFVSKSSGYYCVAQNKYGSQKSAALPDTLKERSIILYVVVGVGLCLFASFFAVIFLMWKKKKRTMEEDDHENVDPNAKGDTYTALDPVSRSSDDVYNTLTTVHSSPSDDPDTTLKHLSLRLTKGRNCRKGCSLHEW
ncbi:B-cell receptor CD22-like [Colossoma macropomum]|uniref:B-cell receptor CD22-like n=1 Tax=Colossoma macropomum TaxID=42526 RepID=UPI001864C3AF|nr:B-cell receptor CD22-like [Colossoma macropomum]